jgi:hypothetical protein
VPCGTAGGTAQAGVVGKAAVGRSFRQLRRRLGPPTASTCSRSAPIAACGTCGGDEGRGVARRGARWVGCHAGAAPRYIAPARQVRPTSPPPPEQRGSYWAGPSKGADPVRRIPRLARPLPVSSPRSCKTSRARIGVPVEGGSPMTESEIVRRTLPEQMVEGHRLGRHVVHDPRSEELLGRRRRGDQERAAFGRRPTTRPGQHRLVHRERPVRGTRLSPGQHRRPAVRRERRRQPLRTVDPSRGPAVPAQRPGWLGTHGLQGGQAARLDQLVHALVQHQPRVARAHPAPSDHRW